MPSLRDAILQIQESSRDLKEITKDYIESLRDGLKFYGDEQVQRHFQTGNAARHGWPSLERKYSRRKLRRWGRRPMLVASGRLRDSVVGRYRIRIDKRLLKGRISFNQAQRYGLWLTFGSFRGARGPRDWATPIPEDEAAIQQVVDTRMIRRVTRRTRRNTRSARARGFNV